MTYSYIKKSPFWFDETLDELRIAFANDGFWVVSNVNIAEKIKSKVDSNFSEYISLWFCNPKLAYDYLKEDINLGIFMPCTVSIYRKNWDVYISAWLPEVVIEKVVNNSKINKMNLEISKTMKNIIDSI